MNTSTHRSAQAENTDEGTETKRNETATGIPDFLTVLSDSLTIGSEVRGRGDVVTVDSKLIASTIDKNGKTWLSDLSPEAQERRWGKQMLIPGDHADELRSADLEAERAAEAIRQRDRDRDGRTLLQSIWEQERAEAAQPKRMRSVTTSGSPTVN